MESAAATAASGTMAPRCSCRLLHHGAAASSSPHSVVWMSADSAGNGGVDASYDDMVAYPSHSILNLATFDGGGGPNNNNRIPTVRTTLRTCTVPNPNLDPAAGDRIITAISKVDTYDGKSASVVGDESRGGQSKQGLLACAFSDGTVNVWHKTSKQIDDDNHEELADDGGVGWAEEVIVGHTVRESKQSTDEEKKAEEDEAGGLASPTSIADVAGIALTSADAAETLLLVATASVDGINLHVRPLQSSSSSAKVSTKTKGISSHPAASISIKVLPQQKEILLVSGTASPRGNKIHVYTVRLPSDVLDISSSLMEGDNIHVVRHHGSLPGHLDWVTCFAFWDFNKLSNNISTDNGHDWFLLASGSHDARVRLWKFHPPSTATMAAGSDDQEDVDDTSSDGDSDDAEEDDLLEEGEARLRILHNDGTETAVTFEALLIGHEEAVTSVTFRPNVVATNDVADAPPCLMTSSMDRTILLWMEESYGDNDDDQGTTADPGGGSGGGGGAWVPISRVGAAGGVLGGPIGSSLSGFVDAKFSPDGRCIAGHGYGGSLHFWSSSGRKSGEEVESERWSAGPCLTGHFRGVSGISWEVSRGQYLLSAGLDQTCRLWAEVPSETDVTWHEVGRPQVHGFDLNALACVPDHRLVSGADEKVTRVFEAPKATLRLLSMTSKSEVSSSTDLERPERAFLPSLGLSNRTTITGGVEEEEGYEAPNDAAAVRSDATSHLQLELPTERDLGLTTLWPESRKLFGHHFEVVCLASTVTPNGDVLVASACKARNVENASIMIFDVQTGRCLQVLKGGHRSTVVTLAFSADGQYLASAGKDRRLCLWRWRSQQEEGGDEAKPNELFYLASAVDSAHRRIIWSVHFCPSDPTLLATGARDGVAKIWQITGSDGEGDGIELKEVSKIEPSCTAKTGGKDKAAVTAIAFAPKLLQSTGAGGAALLSVGMETGVIELWSIRLSSQAQPSSGTDTSPISCQYLFTVPLNLCHISTVKHLAFRPSGFRNEEKEAKEGGRLELTLASCGMDNGVRIYGIQLS